MAKTKRFCPNCGGPLDEKDKVCGFCNAVCDDDAKVEVPDIEVPKAEIPVPRVGEGKVNANMATGGSTGINKSMFIGVGVGVIICALGFMLFGGGKSETKKSTTTTTQGSVKPNPPPTAGGGQAPVKPVQPTGGSSANGLVPKSDANYVYFPNSFYKGDERFVPYQRLERTSNPNYYKYVNPRFGCSIAIPAEFTKCKVPSNNAGCVFENGEGAEINISAMHNALRRSARAQFNEEVRNIPNLATKLCGDTWYAISYLKGNNVVYKKVFLNDRYENVFYMEYPRSLKYKCDSYVEYMEPTFVPTWKSSYPVRG